MPREAAVAAEAARVAAAEAARAAARELEPLSVFVSRKAGRLYVRQGFEPLFDMPVTIRDADKPLGTHLYTAMEFTADRAAMRWVAVALPTQAAAEPVSPRGRKKAAAIEVVVRPAAPMAVQLAAANALDRVDMPKEAVDRISDLLWYNHQTGELSIWLATAGVFPPELRYTMAGPGGSAVPRAAGPVGVCGVRGPG